MGFYLNSNKPSTLYANEIKKPYFVDKTDMIKELIPLVESGTQYVCITRPRRFGKTIIANMIGAYFGKNNKGSMFDSLKIAEDPRDKKHRNQHNVIYINFSNVGDDCETYKDYISEIKDILNADLYDAFPNVNYRKKGSVSESLGRIYEAEEAKFIFVFDEWDYIFHQDFITAKDKKKYIKFLHDLLKDQPYVELAYMTGILPISQYSSGTGVNMFLEYKMASKEKYGLYFGFTQSEVEMLYDRYLKQTENPKVTLEGLQEWYDGYDTFDHQKLYNPRSIVASLSDNQLADYWTSSGPYEEIYYYVKNDVAGIRDDIAKLIAGEEVSTVVAEYSAASQKISTRDEIFSAMIVYGFLTVDNGKIKIPNKELMNKFVDMVKKENSLGYVYNLAKQSDRMTPEKSMNVKWKC